MTIPNAPMRNTLFDVFLAYSRVFLPQVTVVAEGLRRLGLKLWIDTEQIPPGRPFLDVIQKAILEVKSAAVFIGPSGLGDWEAFELRAFIPECVKRGIPVIPVLLPGVDKVPEEYPFLAQLVWVQFKEHLYEKDALEALEWGIRGLRPQRD